MIKFRVKAGGLDEKSMVRRADLFAVGGYDGV